MTPDEIITKITEAATMAEAQLILKTVSRKSMLAVADQLYVDTEGHGDGYVRLAIVTEARS